MTDNHHPVRETMGAYLLGDLDEAERARLRNHLRGCSQCRAELASLTPLVASVADVDIDALYDEPTPDESLEQRVLAAVAGERRRERRRTAIRAGGLAAAAALLAAVAFGAGIAVDRTDSTTQPTVPLEPVAVVSNRPGVTARADLVDHSWGVEIKLEVRGLREGVRYRGTVRDTDGREHPAGAFLGVSDTTVLCNMTTSVLRDDAVAFVVRAPDGRAVLRSRL
jgi:hypothetical protein